MTKLDPAFKFLAIFLVSIILAFTYKVALNLTVFGLSLCLLAASPTVNKKSLLLGLGPFLLAAAGLFGAGFLFPAEGDGISGSWGQATITVESWSGAWQLASRALAFGGLGLLFALTTEPVEFVAGLMWRFRAPSQIAYGLLAAYRFLPLAMEEYRMVRAARRMRGLSSGLFSPSLLTPMLVRAFERAESVAMAMESRGFSGQAPRRSAFTGRLKAVDFIFFGFSVGATLTASLFGE
ncbi:MAG: energy-coupling factor transporter transmembrane protein EcfT [Deltaproteobacteria bacterium]|jgi:energy-coupling factor transporter transmembrane protein EcfT|nr:energy-coupling factor transporter transmembrane protein EcfT [Deltaproteobacteria bacterium]